MIKLSAVESKSEVMERHRGQAAKGRDRCFLCEKPLDHPAVLIHVCLCCGTILAHGERCPNGYDEDGAGGSGCFPVGSECIKRLPKAYRY